MFRKIFSVLFYMLAGFVLGSVCFFAFMNTADPTKFILIGFYLVVFLILLFIGLLISGFKNVKRSSGFVILWSVGGSLFWMFSFACMLTLPEISKVYTLERFTKDFGDYFMGITVTGLFSMIGIFLLIEKKQEIKLGQ